MAKKKKKKKDKKDKNKKKAEAEEEAAEEGEEKTVPRWCADRCMYRCIEPQYQIYDDEAFPDCS